MEDRNLEISVLGSEMGGIVGFLPEELCDAIQTLSESVEPVNGATGMPKPTNDPDEILYGNIPRGIEDDETRLSELRWLDHNLLSSIKGVDLPEMIIDACLQIAGYCGWNYAIAWEEMMQHTTYRATKQGSGHYTWHSDIGIGGQDPSTTVRKLSCSIQLSDPDEYEGGYFQWLEQNDLQNRMAKEKLINHENLARTLPYSFQKKGSIIAFPSTTIHQVTPITSGIRKSSVIWFSGPPLQ